MTANAQQFYEIGAAPISPAAAREQIKSLIEKVDPGNRQETVTRISGLLTWYRDLIDDELIAAWKGYSRGNLPELIESLADSRIALGIVEFSWRQQRSATFIPTYAAFLGNLMERYPESARLFVEDLLAPTNQSAPNLSRAEAETVCRILLDMPDIGNWRRTALQVLPRYRAVAEDLLDQDVRGNDQSKGYAAQRWLSSLKVLESGFSAQSGSLAAHPPTPTQAPAAPRASERHNGTCATPPSGLVGWWPGDRDFNDLVGGNNPSAVNGVTLVRGEVANGFTFGRQGYIEIPKSPTLQNQRFTWLAWVRPDGPGPNSASLIINQNIDGNHASINVNWRPGDRRFTFHSGDGRTELIVSKDEFPAGDFYLVAATYDGDIFKLFVNGLLEGYRSESRPVAYSSGGWKIGSGTPRFFPGFPDTWNGVIDEVQAYNRALSADELGSILQAGQRRRM